MFGRSGDRNDPAFSDGAWWVWCAGRHWTPSLLRTRTNHVAEFLVGDIVGRCSLMNARWGDQRTSPGNASGAAPDGIFVAVADDQATILGRFRPWKSRLVREPPDADGTHAVGVLEPRRECRKIARQPPRLDAERAVGGLLERGDAALAVRPSPSSISVARWSRARESERNTDSTACSSDPPAPARGTVAGHRRPPRIALPAGRARARRLRASPLIRYGGARVPAPRVQ